MWSLSLLARWAGSRQLSVRSRWIPSGGVTSLKYPDQEAQRPNRTLISFWMTVRKKLATAAGSAMAARAEVAASRGASWPDGVARYALKSRGSQFLEKARNAARFLRWQGGQVEAQQAELCVHGTGQEQELCRC